jgi:putative membrane protein insertion efficiency factor
MCDSHSTASTAAAHGLAVAPGLASRLLIFLLALYKAFFSPLLPSSCKFYPTCSSYAQEAVARHGVARGLGLALRRLLRCRPFSPGGYDPVPDA